MIEESLKTLFKVKFKLANNIMEELPSPIQETVKKHKNDFLHSMIELMKDELAANNHTPEKDSIKKIKSISIE